jgi:hypothetical protein
MVAAVDHGSLARSISGKPSHSLGVAAIVVVAHFRRGLLGTPRRTLRCEMIRLSITAFMASRDGLPTAVAVRRNSSYRITLS